MEYKFYLSGFNGTSYEKTLVKRSVIDFDVYEARNVIGRRKIWYYLSKTGGVLTTLMYGEQPSISIYLGEKVKTFFEQLEMVFKCYKYDDVAREIKCFEYIQTARHELSDFIGETKAHQKFWRKEGYLEYDRELGLLSYTKRGKEATMDGINTTSNLEILLDYADHLLYEISHFKIDLSKLPKSEAYKSYENSKLSPQLRHAIAVGGMFVVKGAIKMAAKTIGGEINFDGDFDIPDLDGDISISDDFDFDLDNGQDFNLDFEGDDADWLSAINGGGIDGITFEGKHYDGYEDLRKTISVPRMGGGGNDTLHLYKKLGSSTIYVSDGYAIRFQ